MDEGDPVVVRLEGERIHTLPTLTPEFNEAHGFQRTESGQLDLTKAGAQELLNALNWWVTTDGKLLPHDERLLAQLREILQQHPVNEPPEDWYGLWD